MNIEDFIKLTEGFGLILTEKDGDLIMNKNKFGSFRDDLEQHKDMIISFMRENKPALKKYIRDNPRKPFSFYKLSPLQEGLLFHGLYDNKSSSYVEQLCLDFPKDLDIHTFKKSWEYLMSQYTILRTGFHHKSLEVPVQCVYEGVALPITELDYSHYSSEEQQEKINVLESLDLSKGFDFTKAPLFRITLIKKKTEHYRMIFTNHHIILDGWSVSILIGQFMAYYNQLKEGNTITAPKVDSFKDYIDYIGQIPSYKSENFWREFLSDIESGSLLPFADKEISRNRSKVVLKKDELNFDKKFTKLIKKFAKKHRLTVNTIMQGVWGLLLSKYTGKSDAVFGVTVSGRPSDMEDAEHRIGLYINMLPLYCKLKSDERLINWLLGIQNSQLASREYQYSSLSHLQQLTNVQGELFDTILVYQNYPEASELSSIEGTLEISNADAKVQTNYPLTLSVAERETLHIGFSYNTLHLHSSSIEMMIKHFQYVLEQFVEASTETLIGGIGIVSSEERHELLEVFNDTSKDYSNHKTVVDAFEFHAANTPDSVAVVYQDEQLTYKELNEHSNRLANYLKDTYTLGTDDRVGVLLEPSLWNIISFLGILKTGAAYVPIDMSLPTTRKSFIINDTDLKVLIIESMNVLDVVDYEIPIYSIDLEFEDLQIGDSNSHNLDIEIAPTDLVYIIYTSGSTGNPKGVMIEHKGFKNIILYQKEFLELSADNGILQFAPLSFDASCAETFLALASGASLFIPTEKERMNVDLLIDLIEINGIDVVNLAPSYQALLKGRNISLKVLKSMGEPLNIPLAQSFQDQGIKVLNGYGPTENTIGITMSAQPILDNDLVTIGKPVANVQVYILGNNLELLPKGITGELYVSGIGVARGYVNAPELTKEKFITNPYVEDERMYRTGDLARWLPDGNIEFVGRRDNQVKIRGYRIELDEIEHALSKITGIKRSCVLAKEETDGNNNLVGYIVKENILEMDDIKTQLIAQLPEYMVPQLWVEMEEFPLTRNGKLDKKSLPEPGAFQGSRKKKVAPTNEIEEKLIVIWQNILSVENIGIEDNFFELGGHSLLAIRMVTNIIKELKEDIDVHVVFEHSTIKELSDYIQFQKIENNKIKSEAPKYKVEL